MRSAVCLIISNFFKVAFHQRPFLVAFLINFQCSAIDSHDVQMHALQLEKHLKDQQVVRGSLEKALGPNAAPVNLSHENPMPKVTPVPKYRC